MTDTRTYKVRGTEVTITASINPDRIKVSITIDLSALDADEPDHSAHNLMAYFAAPGYVKRDTYWWCKAHREVLVRTGSQAQRVIRHALAVLDDAVSAAVIARTARKSEMDNVWA